MATITLAEHLLRVKSKLVLGITQEILDVNPMFVLMPWNGYAGSGIITNREQTLGDADFYGLGDTITSKAASDSQDVTFKATRVIGDAEIDGLQQAESEGSGNDNIAIEVASKAKSVGRKIQTGIATGSGSNPQMNSLHSMVDSGQYATTTGNIFDDLDLLCSMVLSKDSMVDWIQLSMRDALKLRSAYRASTGVPMMEIKSGNRTIKVMEFNGIPVFVNSFLSITETANGAALTGGALSSMYAGNFDDGSEKVGVAMIHPQARPAGITVTNVGTKADKDQDIIRVKAYCNFASFNKTGIARLTDRAA